MEFVSFSRGRRAGRGIDRQTREFCPRLDHHNMTRRFIRANEVSRDEHGDTLQEELSVLEVSLTCFTSVARVYAMMKELSGWQDK